MHICTAQGKAERCFATGTIHVRDRYHPMYHESHYIRSKIETNGTTRLAGPKTMPTRGSYAPYIYISNAIIGMNESKILKLELFDVLARVNTWMRRCDDASEAAGTM